MRDSIIAQPGDKNIRFIRQIGAYDYYSVNWGYRVIRTQILNRRRLYWDFWKKR
jgi:hypothetical protein